MTDFAIRFTDKPTFDAIHRAIFNSLAPPPPLPEDQPVPMQHLTQTGTHWFVDEIGVMYEQTGVDGEGAPIMTARDGWHVNLRWNGGDDPPPDNLPGMEIVWRSDAVDINGDPVPRPEWWNRVIA